MCEIKLFHEAIHLLMLKCVLIVYRKLLTLTCNLCFRPDTIGYLNKVEKERSQRENPTKDNRGFLAKYWMYIVPIALVMMVQNAGSGQ